MSQDKLSPASLNATPVFPPDAVAIRVSCEHVPASHFGMGLWGDAWLECGSSLLRAAKVLLYQVSVDVRDMRAVAEAAVAGGPYEPSARAHIDHQAALLAVLAVENALKAVIGAQRQASNARVIDGRLPKEFKSHDLQQLAKSADIATADQAEIEVLRAGELVTEYLGRYPSAASAPRMPAVATLVVSEVVAACERLFLKCAEVAVRMAWRADSDRVAEMVAVYRERMGSVPAPLPGKFRSGLATASMRTTPDQRTVSIALPLK